MTGPASGDFTIGVGLPNFGDTLDRVDGRDVARAVEEAGFDGLWLTDHILLPDHIESKYPFSPDGTFFLPEGGTWYESVVTLAYVASATTRLQLGIGVCVAALRDPRLLSQQLASLDRLTGGRVTLGVGAGWLREEFEAFEVPFERRGARLDGAIDVMRDCWTGQPTGGEYGPYTLPNGLNARPTPVQPRLPILLAGEGDRALDRMVQRGDGWYGASGIKQLLPLEIVHRVREGLKQRCTDAGRPFEELVLALRLAIPVKELGSQALAEQLVAYNAAGVTSFTIDFSWRSLGDGVNALEALKRTVQLARGDVAVAAEL